MGFSISGLSGSGLDTASLVSQLMQAERIPQTKITARQQVAQKQVAAWKDLRIKMQALQTAAEAMQTPGQALGSVATSSDAKVLGATATPDAVPGTYSVQVTQVATAQQLSWSNLPSATSLVGAGATGVATGSLASSLSYAGVGATAGLHTVEVTQASNGALVLGTTAPALSYGLLGSSATVSIDGAATKTLTLQSSYATADALVTDLNTQLGSAATVSLVNGKLQVQGASEGATHSLTFGGASVAALGLPTATFNGMAGVVAIDGVAQTVEPASTGTRTQLLGTSGISLAVGTTLRPSGVTQANVAVTTSTSTLTDLQAMLSIGGSPVTASLVSGNTGSTLVLSGTQTGTVGNFVESSTLAAFDPTLGTTTASKQAQVTVNGTAVTRDSNTLTGVVTGLTLNVLSLPAAGAAPTTITVARDNAGAADKVKSLVAAMNALLDTVSTDTKYDLTAKSGGPLVGDSTARSLASTLFSAAATTSPSGTIQGLSQLGIETTRDGRFVFKPDALTKSLAAAPDAVGTVLSSFSASIASFAKASAESGGLLTSRSDGAQADVDSRQREFDAMEVRLTATQRRYSTQFAKLDTTLSSLNSQKSAIGAALSAFTSGR